VGKVVGPNSTFISKVGGMKALTWTAHLRMAGGNVCGKGRVAVGRQEFLLCL